jgi:integrase
MKRVRYQFGSLKLLKGAHEDVWTFRFYENGPDGKRRYRRVRVGTKSQYATEALALRAIEGLRLSVNTVSYQLQQVCLRGLVQRFLDEELSKRFSTRSSYLSILRRHIKPRWDEISIVKIRSLEVERWLKSLQLAPKTKANIRNLMHLLFECARRWELIERNPIELVRQQIRRQTIPKRLCVEEFQKLIGELSEPCRTMAILAACLGLRIGEVLGLQWGDIDLLNGRLTVNRSVYQFHVGPAKTQNSEAALPLAPGIVDVLSNWLSVAPYRTANDWVFASKKGGLLDGDKLRKEILQPAAERAGVGKIGWHSLRHSFATALDSTGARMKVAQELMRHANIATTMDVYTGVLERDKREAVGRVARSFLGRIQ